MGDVTPIQSREERRTDFLRRVPSFADDGFDLTTGNVSMRLEFELGRWQERDEEPHPEGDQDLDALRIVHEQTHGTLRDVLGMLKQVADDDDPTLNAAGRLKIAAKLIEPKLHALQEMAEREVDRVAAALQHEADAITQAAKHVEPGDAPLLGDIRRHFQGLKPERRAAMVTMAIHQGDRQTLQALATAPAYLSDLSSDMHGRVVEAYRALVAPERAKRVARLRTGLVRTAKALSALERKTTSLIDFTKARQLIEREAARNA